MNQSEIDDQHQPPWLPLSGRPGQNRASEPAISYEAFQKYLTMRNRSLKKLAGELGKSVKLLERWSSQFHWRDRVNSWDEHQGGFSKPENWSCVTMKNTDWKENRQRWLPLPARQGKNGATETALNYEAFQKYYAMPPSQRSLRELGRQLGKSEKLFERWSSKFEWRERSAAWDQHQAHIFAAEYEQQQRQKATLAGEELDELNKRLYEASEKLLNRADQMLASPLIETVLERDASGRPTVILKPARWSFNTMVDIARFGFKLGDEAIKSARQQYGFLFSNSAR